VGRKYVDFWINLTDEVDLSEMVSEVKKLGFRSVVVSSVDESRLREFKKLGEDFKIEVYRKLIEKSYLELFGEFGLNEVNLRLVKKIRS
jgi:RNase P/RNase MRP subunit POP5